MSNQIHRREFLRQSAMTTTTFYALPLAVRAVASKKVIVIGAGLAGLVAAYELTQARHEVTILEARTRAGGRVLTLREPFADGLYAEAGASQIPANHDLTNKYVRHFGLQLNPVEPSRLTSVSYIRGERRTVRPDQPVNWPLALTPAERKLGLDGLFEKYVMPTAQRIGDTRAVNWPAAELKPYDQVSFAEFMRQQGASPAAISWLGFGYYDLWGDGLEKISALMLLREVSNQSGGHGSYAIKGGNDLLPRAFAARMSEKIRYGSPVVRIEQDARGVRAVFLQAGASQTLAGDYLICTIPFGVLRQIEIAPRFPPDKQRAVEQLPYMAISRVYLQTRRRYWIEQGLTGSAAIDVPPTILSEETASQPGPRGILHSFMSGEQARQVTAMKESARISHAIELIEKIYPGLREHFEGGATKCWDEDEWARGAAAWFRPGQMNAFLPHLARPEGRIHFAGEHVSPWPGWMQGALFSGIRAAREVHEAPA